MNYKSVICAGNECGFFVHVLKVKYNDVGRIIEQRDNDRAFKAYFQSFEINVSDFL